ncbi:hypothetical protein JL722_8805 [Aureococcus anophagefferens]|nr:hypothetical protein JL722_8805 [Aureococcus anophagefferens]
MIARPKFGRNEWKTAERGAFRTVFPPRLPDDAPEAEVLLHEKENRERCRRKYLAKCMEHEALVNKWKRAKAERLADLDGWRRASIARMDKEPGGLKRKKKSALKGGMDYHHVTKTALVDRAVRSKLVGVAERTRHEVCGKKGEGITGLVCIARLHGDDEKRCKALRILLLVASVPLLARCVLHGNATGLCVSLLNVREPLKAQLTTFPPGRMGLVAARVDDMLAPLLASGDPTQPAFLRSLIVLLYASRVGRSPVVLPGALGDECVADQDSRSYRRLQKGRRRDKPSTPADAHKRDAATLTDHCRGAFEALCGASDDDVAASGLAGFNEIEDGDVKHLSASDRRLHYFAVESMLLTLSCAANVKDEGFARLRPRRGPRGEAAPERAPRRPRGAGLRRRGGISSALTGSDARELRDDARDDDDERDDGAQLISVASTTSQTTSASLLEAPVAPRNLVAQMLLSTSSALSRLAPRRPVTQAAVDKVIRSVPRSAIIDGDHSATLHLDLETCRLRMTTTAPTTAKLKAFGGKIHELVLNKKYKLAPYLIQMLSAESTSGATKYNAAFAVAALCSANVAAAAPCLVEQGILPALAEVDAWQARRAAPVEAPPWEAARGDDDGDDDDEALASDDSRYSGPEQFCRGRLERFDDLELPRIDPSICAVTFDNIHEITTRRRAIGMRRKRAQKARTAFHHEPKAPPQSKLAKQLAEARAEDSATARSSRGSRRARRRRTG